MARKKSTDDTGEGIAENKPKKTKKKRWYHQLAEVYRMTRETDPAIRWWLLGIFFGIIGVGVLLGQLLSYPIYIPILSLPIATIAAMAVLARRAERAAYSRIRGQTGAVKSALTTIRRGWSIEEDPVAIDPRTQDNVHRLVGLPGVVLISEGPSHRVGRLLEKERKKVARVVPTVTIHLVQVGQDDGQVDIAKLTKHLRRLKRSITKAEVHAVSSRLRALSRTGLGLPKGIDPFKARPDRRAMKGR